MNNPVVFGRYNPLIQNSRENLQNFFNEQPSDIVIFVIEKKDKTRIGIILYFIIKARPYELFEIGYFLIPEERGKGYCTEAVKIMVDFLFLTKQIVRVQAATDVKNIGSQKVLEKAGFTKEGILRKLMFNRGEWRDFILFSVLKDEWKEPKILKFHE
jgi:aminoglycoside 6'-N-acetyltransferase